MRFKAFVTIILIKTIFVVYSQFYGTMPLSYQPEIWLRWAFLCRAASDACLLKTVATVLANLVLRQSFRSGSFVGRKFIGQGLAQDAGLANLVGQDRDRGGLEHFGDCLMRP